MRDFLNYSSKLFVLILSLTLFVSCDEDGLGANDPCDDTVVVSVNLFVRLFVLDDSGDGLAGELVYFEIYKRPCGEPRKGLIASDVTTPLNGLVFSNYASYNLRNTEDVVEVNVRVADLNGPGNDANIVRTLNYDNFAGSYDLSVEMTINRDY